MMYEDDAQKSTPEQSGDGVTHQPADERREAESAEHHDPHVPFFLPLYDRILRQIPHVILPVRFVVVVENPDDVRPPETALDAVRIPFALSVRVMAAVAAGPLQ